MSPHRNGSPSLDAAREAWETRPMWSLSHLRDTQLVRHAAWHRAPGPRAPTMPAHPIFGHLREMSADQLGFCLRTRERCGDIARLRFVVLPAHLLSHPDHVRHVLVDAHRSYDKQTKGFNVLRLVLGNGLVTSEGDFWKRQRRIAQPAFHRDRIASFARSMVQASEDACARFEAHATSGEPLDLSAEMMRLTLRIAGETLLSEDVTRDAEEVGTAVTLLLHEANQRILRPLDFPLSIPTPNNRRIIAAVEQLNRIVRRIIEDRRAAASRPNDLLTMLMETRDEETGETMTVEQLRDEVITMFLAGHETTANALAWTFYLLSKHPDVHRRALAETRAVVRGRSPELADLANLPYSTAVLKESMRLYPPAWIIGRRAAVADTIEGFEIPQNSVVFVSPWVTHRHPAFWENPEGFDPERFLPERAATHTKYAYFPFGAGPRMCIGAGFAMMEAGLCLATILSRFRFDLVPGRPIVPQASITLRPKHGLPMHVHRAS